MAAAITEPMAEPRLVRTSTPPTRNTMCRAAHRPAQGDVLRGTSTFRE
jgi:hypothetical protein